MTASEKKSLSRVPASLPHDNICRKAPLPRFALKPSVAEQAARLWREVIQALLVAGKVPLRPTTTLAHSRESGASPLHPLGCHHQLACLHTYYITSANCQTLRQAMYEDKVATSGCIERCNLAGRSSNIPRLLVSGRHESSGGEKPSGPDAEQLVGRLQALISENEVAAEFAVPAVAQLSWEQLQTVQVGPLAQKI